GDAFGGVDDHEGDVRRGQRLPGPEHGVEVGVLGDLRLAADPGRVDDHVAVLVDLHLHVDGVAGGAGDVGDDDPLLPDQPVEQRRLANVGTADDGEAGKV